MKVAINGFGRIGRIVLRAAVKKGVLGTKFDVAAINDLGGAQSAMQLLKYDSVHGKLDAELKARENWISVDGVKIPVLAEKEPQNLPWKEMGVDCVLECSGVFTDREGMSKHLQAGAKKVLLSAPAKKGGADITVVIGVNDEKYDKKKHQLISMASCTTNSLAPVAKLINDNYKVEKGFMTTVHAYTNDQKILDVAHKDPRRARAAAMNIIPTSTGAAKALGEVVPELAGKMDGVSLRVPIPCGSITDIAFFTQKEASKEEINKMLKKAADGKLKEIMEYSEEPLVSTDIVGNPHSAIIDGLSTMSMGNAMKVFSWYDNEWGYSNRMVDMVLKVL